MEIGVYNEVKSSLPARPTNYSSPISSAMSMRIGKPLSAGNP